jgi:hypothetical protein
MAALDQTWCGLSRAWLLLGVTVLFLAGGTTSAPGSETRGEAPVLASVEEVSSRGLVESPVGRDLVEAAIVRTNALAAGSAGLLRPSWQAASLSSLTVYLVVSRGVSAGNAVGVPRNCRCVFVQVEAFRRWIAGHSTGTARLTLDEADVLAFMLLHELGHLRQFEHVVDFDRGELVALNVEPSLDKAREERADEFAANLVRSGLSAGKPMDVALTAGAISVALSSLSWNLQASRSLDEFGSAALGTPSAFFDVGYSHPNLGWRVLRVNDLIQQSALSRQLLEGFEAARGRGANPKPIYQAPN